MIGGLLAFAPAIVKLVAEPDLAVFFPTAHLCLMDRTQTHVFGVSVAVAGFEGGVAGLRLAALALQVGKRRLRFLDDLLAAFTAQRQLAAEAFGREIQGIPGSGCFAECLFGHGIHSFQTWKLEACRIAAVFNLADGCFVAECFPIGFQRQGAVKQVGEFGQGYPAGSRTAALAGRTGFVALVGDTGMVVVLAIEDVGLAVAGEAAGQDVNFGGHIKSPWCGESKKPRREGSLQGLDGWIESVELDRGAETDTHAEGGVCAIASAERLHRGGQVVYPRGVQAR